MVKLFGGFCFAFLNFTLSLNQFSLNVIPDFVGYILLLKGAEELAEESHFFQSVRPFAVGMAIYTGILWIGSLFGVGSGGWISQILNIVAMLVALYVSWVLIQGVREMEDSREADFNGRRLHQRWKELVVLTVAAKLLFLMVNLVNFGIITALSVLLILADLVWIVLYLIAWNQSAKMYELHLGQAESTEENTEEPE